MKLSIVVPTLNEESWIGNLISDVCAQSEKSFELIIVDAGSKDKTAHVIKRLAAKDRRVKLYVGSRGIALQRNLGISKAKGEWILFLDADVRLDKDFVRNLLVWCERRSVTLCTPKYVPYDAQSIGVRWFYRFVDGVFAVASWFSPMGAGACMLVSRKSAVPFFDSKFIVGEDVEWLRRAAITRRYKIAPIKVGVSSRRFSKNGTTVGLRYLKIGFLLSIGAYAAASKVEYPFGTHSKTR